MPTESTAEIKWRFMLYTACNAEESSALRARLDAILQEHLGSDYRLEVIDLIEKPHVAEIEDIFAVPTLIRRSPLPARKLVGDLTNIARVVSSLGIG